jgi:hypothetical protein
MRAKESNRQSRVDVFYEYVLLLWNAFVFYLEAFGCDSLVIPGFSTGDMVSLL